MSHHFNEIYSALYAGGVGAMGGVAKLLFNLNSGKRYTLWAIVLHVSLAFFAGRMAGEFLPDSMEMKDGLLGVAGFMAYAIMKVIETYVPKLLENWLDSKTGMENRDKEGPLS